MVIFGVWPDETGLEAMCSTNTEVFAAGWLASVAGPAQPAQRLAASQAAYTGAFKATGEPRALTGTLKGCGAAVGESQDFSMVGRPYTRTLWLCEKEGHLYFAGYSARTDDYDPDRAAAWRAGVTFD